VEGYSIPVLNEREIRAAAGLLFLMMFISILEVLYRGNFAWLKYAVVLFMTDILIRVLVSPRFAPSLIIGRLIVKNQTPEYVGAKQKLFAWIIGIVLAVTMFVLLVVLNTYSIVTGLICLICLIFLFFESAFGICIGCKIYPWFHKGKVQYCPGEICEIKDRQAIQKTTWVQLLIAAVFVAYFFLLINSLKGTFSQQPHALFGEEVHQQSK
jgi:hypothetical protein